MVSARDRPRERRRQRLAWLLLALSSAALIATSQLPGMSRSASGEVAVGPDQPATIDVRFDVPAFSGATPDYGYSSNVSASLRTSPGDPVTVAWHGTIDDMELAFDAEGHANLPTDDCADGCVVVLHADIAWTGGAAAALHVRWSTSMFIAAEPYSADRIAVTASSGEPAVARTQWFGIGLIAGGLLSAGWLLLGARYRRVRLGLAGLGLAVPLVLITIRLGNAAANAGPLAMDATSQLVTALLFALPAVPLAFGLLGYRRGRPTSLAMSGWLSLLLYGAIFAIAVDGAGTYRPHEVALLGFGLALTAGAAITSPALLGAGHGAGQGRVILMTSQAILLAVLVPYAGLSIFSVVPAVTVGVEIGTLLDLAAPIAAFVLLAFGVLRFQRGSRWLLVVTNALLAIPLAIFAAVASTPLLGGAVLQVPAMILAGAAVVGVVCGLVLTPGSGIPSPAPTEPPGNDERGQGDQVGGVHGESDRAEIGQGS